MLGLRRRGAGQEGLTGVAVRGDVVTIAHVRPDASGVAHLTVCDEVAAPDGPERALRAAVEEHGLAGTRCRAVLPPHHYALRLVDAPEVPESELRDAARWLVRDLIEFDVAEAALDVLLLPPSPVPNRPRRMLVAAARAEGVRRLAEHLREAGLEPAGIEIPETALANLVPPIGSEPRSTAVLELGAKEGLLVICEGRQLFVARQLSVGTEHLDAPAADALFAEHEPAAGGAIETLVLEIQRSLDYYESVFGHSAVRELVVAPTEDEIPPLLPHLADRLALSVSPLDLARAAGAPGTLSQSLATRSLHAIASALGDPAHPALDLYGPELDGPGAPLPARRLAQAVGAAAAVLAVATGVAAWNNYSAAGDLAILQSRRAALEERVAELGRQYASRPADAELAARVARLAAERDAKAQLLEQLTTRAGGDATRFPGVLEGLARRPVRGLWLRGIEVGDGGRSLALVGSALDPDRIPALLERLRTEPVFAGTAFEVVRLERAADGAAIDFELRTALPGEAP